MFLHFVATTSCLIIIKEAWHLEIVLNFTSFCVLEQDLYVLLRICWNLDLIWEMNDGVCLSLCGDFVYVDEFWWQIYECLCYCKIYWSMLWLEILLFRHVNLMWHNFSYYLQKEQREMVMKLFISHILTEKTLMFQVLNWFALCCSQSFCFSVKSVTFDSSFIGLNFVH